MLRKFAYVRTATSRKASYQATVPLERNIEKRKASIVHSPSALASKSILHTSLTSLLTNTSSVQKANSISRRTACRWLINQFILLKKQRRRAASKKERARAIRIRQSCVCVIHSTYVTVSVRVSVSARFIDKYFVLVASTWCIRDVHVQDARCRV